MPENLDPQLEPIERLSMDAAELMRRYPPRIENRNKQAVFEIALPGGSQPGGRIEYSRWDCLPLPDEPPSPAKLPAVVPKPGFYDYLPHLGPPAFEWHVNFADPDLFFAYGIEYFAQDEMMCAEHPVLGSVREAALAMFGSAVTEVSGRPTPVLVAGAERRCRIDVSADPHAGRPEGLYGRNFARADVDAVRQATHPVVPPTVTNVLAMAAPNGGRGRYAIEEICRIVQTAYTAFVAARLESRRLAGAPVPVAIHTGFWGCGAFGGNRILMTLLQILAAGLAGVDVLVYFTSDDEGRKDFSSASSLLREQLLRDSRASLASVLLAVEGLGLRWARSDGN